MNTEMENGTQMTLEECVPMISQKQTVGVSDSHVLPKELIFLQKKDISQLKMYLSEIKSLRTKEDGEKSQQQCTDGRTASYSGDRNLSAADLITRQYLEKELGTKVENMIATAKREVEESLVKSLEQKLKENLAKETIERMNIPDVLKRFSEMALEDKTE